VTSNAHRVVIIGGGFGGLYAAKALKRAPVRVTLIDRRNFHLFQPLLYQVATAGLAPGDIASPLRNVLRRQRNAQVRLGEVVDIDPRARNVRLRAGEVEYDTLIVAAGSETAYFGHEDWEARAPGLKTVEDALAIRSRVLSAFEVAEWERDPDARRAWLTFVLVGGGPTGVELAGTIADIARDTLGSDFRRMNSADARIVLLEAGPLVLPTFPERLSAAATRQLQSLGVAVRTNTMVTNIEDGAVRVEANGQAESIESRTVLWAAGVRPAPLAAMLARRTGASMDEAGHVQVEPDFSLPAYANIHVVGDMATYPDPSGAPLPGLAAVAQQQGRYVGKLIHRRLRGKRDGRPFRYADKGALAIVGRAKGVADVGPLHFAGYPAWLFWLFVHIMLLAGYENRLLVLVQWAFNYFTRNRSTRLITGPQTSVGRETVVTCPQSLYQGLC
jgi:NADH dehydrogenase